jgi:hypothetical protein
LSGIEGRTLTAARIGNSPRTGAPADADAYFAVATRRVLPSGFVCRRGESHQINFQK